MRSGDGREMELGGGGGTVIASPPVNRAGTALTSSAHVVNDLYQGAVPALLPFLVLERHYTYAAVSGLTLAATVLSSVAQPAFGWLTDHRPMRWLIPVGILTAATGVALAGLTTSYLLTWIVVALSGLGVAAFHPDGARAARQAAGESTRAMSVFALGGNVGFALGTLVTTPVLVLAGLQGTVLLVVPAVLMATLLFARLSHVLDGRKAAGRVPSLPTGADDWRSFLQLTSVVVIRSIVFFGITSFLALYFIHRLGVSTSAGNAALTLFLVAGAAGTLLGGWVADWHGRLTSIRIGFGLAVPAMAGLVLAPGPVTATACVALLGIALYMPFSVFVVLGQDYLPQRIGTASGVTVGLAVSIGGLFSPFLGWLGDRTDLRVVLMILTAGPLLGLLLTRGLRDPSTRRPAAATARHRSGPGTLGA